MTLRTFPFNNTDGTTVTTANSGLNAVSIGAGGSAIYRTAAAHQGTTGIRLTAAGAAVTVKGSMPAPSSQGATSLVFKIPSAAPSTDISLITFTDTGGGRQCQVVYASGSNGGRFFTNDKNNTYTSLISATQANSTNLPAGTFVRIEQVVTSVSATTGSFTARLYNADTGVQIGSTVSITNGNLGGNNISSVNVGVNVATTYTVDLDSFQVSDSGAGEIGAYSSSINPPTVTMSSDVVQTTLNAAVALGATATTDTGNGMTLDHYNWTVLSYPPELGSAPTISNPTSASPQFTPTVSGRYQFQATATDSGGNTSTPGVQTVYVPGTIVEIIDTLSNVGGFTISALGNLTDNNDATDLAAPVSAVSEATFTGQLAPLIASPSSFSYVVKYKLDAAASGVTFKVRLIEGGTVRKEWTPTAPTTTAQTYDCTLTSGELATVSDWTKLKIQFAWQTTT